MRRKLKMKNLANLCLLAAVPQLEGGIVFAASGQESPDPPIRCLPPHDARKNRFLSVLEENVGEVMAMQVELLEIEKCCAGGTNDNQPCTEAGDCPDGTCQECVQCFFNDPCPSVGMTWWVSKPRCTNYSAQDRTETDPLCEGGDRFDNIWRSQLTVDPVCHGGDNNDLSCVGDADCPGGLCGRSVWPRAHPDEEQNCVHIGDCEIIPMATYAVRVTTDPLAPDPEFSEDLIIGTIKKPGSFCWADCVGIWNGNEWTPPNEMTGFDDIMAAVFFFKTHPNKPNRTWVEVNDASPDMVVGFGDIQMIINGFKGWPYPSFPAPADCPADITPPWPG